MEGAFDVVNFGSTKIMYFSGCPIEIGPVVKSLNGKNELISNTSRNATLDPLDSDSVILSV